MRQPHKMVKHPQAIRRQQPTNCLSVSDHFVGLAFKWLTATLITNSLMEIHLIDVKVINLIFCFTGFCL